MLVAGAIDGVAAGFSEHADISPTPAQRKTALDSMEVKYFGIFI
jgi:hypothetical protein